ncbi:hypothetical protein SMI01S_11790 [Sphingobacterium mizutaii NBRC 14946 = DSM 11724]|uniref:DNA methylase n=3 Tax=Sphingobacterium mizutaii TaxID=1010 RepID=A0AAJ5C0T2_9SPHI|nr:hypothetical protein SMI01S_11790 [Sphingobacterium mizutaii NBRC 14946 = DSM 11724]SDL14492.1 Methylase of polypeptide chain release factors [Sphingobacterium mizutaii]SNV52152.1 DNA methylase [Sphingobacterium mizutaii]
MLDTFMSKSVTNRVIKTEEINWRELKFLQSESFKEFTKEEMQKLKNSILSNSITQPFYVWEFEGTLFCLDGFHRTIANDLLLSEGHSIPELLPATFVHCENKQEAAKLVLQYSSVYAKVSQSGFEEFLNQYELDAKEMLQKIDLPEFDDIDFLSALNKEIGEATGIESQSLQDKFLIPPFSILDSRQGYWQDRKRSWNSLGFNSQETREDIELIAESGQSTAIYDLRNKMREALGRDPEWSEIIAEAKKRKMHIYEGASIFDPVLAEVCYRWFCPDGGSILDPFAGGSVRGLVAAYLGYFYDGIDLRSDQVVANEKQALSLNLNKNANWIVGDSNEILNQKLERRDFIFSCPPYHDLEKYSEDPADLSNMEYDQFIDIYRSIISKAVSHLKDNRFASFVVGDIRDKDGNYRNFVSDTISAFQDAGMKLYNEIILVNVAGSLPMRMGKQFPKYRKVGKMHQNVLVFYKGNIKSIPEEIGVLTNVEDSLKAIEI